MAHHWRQQADLAHDTVSHEWLWSLHPSYDQTLEPEVFVDAVPVRQSAPKSPVVVMCAVCGEHALPVGWHALCCAPGPSHEGRNR
eukprot:4736259-Prorocentrum_lima.AAC.1